MSCSCGGSCNCGSGCSCGSKKYQDLETSATTTIIIEGVAPKKMDFEESEKSFGAEGGHGCKCGSNCNCDPCNC
uniref:Metallothionein-like protein n=1 Tax=Catharanthus roseus TaxID=4058 RepID=Q2QKE5_CATRO|nr:metallothionein [Catharanthus roseus]